MKRILDLFDGFYNPSSYKGIFACLNDNNTFNALFTAAGITPALADDYYMNFRSGEKLLNRTFERILEKRFNGTVGNAALKLVADMIILSEHEKYNRMLDIIMSEYNPIENYDRYEDLQKDYSSSGGSTEDATNHDTGTETIVDQIEGFNSSTFQDSNKSTKTDNLTHTADIDRTHELEGEETNTNHIHGNIGVTTADQMLNGYKDFWSEFNILEMVSQDIDDIITTNSY